MEITKNKKSIRQAEDLLQIFYRFLNPYPCVWFSFWKSETFGKSDFWFADVFLEIFYNPKAGMDFPITNLRFYKRCFIKDNLQKHFCIVDGVLCAKKIHRLGPMDLNIYSLERNP
jgi:hypothetical protein